MKNLVLGAAIGYRPKDTKTFVKSFRKHNKVDDVFLLVYKNIDAEGETKEFLKEYNINYLVCDETYVKGASINNTRYFKYLEFLKENRYKNIFLTDVRDVVFLENLFDGLFANEFLWCFEEDGVIGKNPYMKRWIEAVFDTSILDRLKTKKIICSGTIIGSYDNIVKYLERMCHFIKNLDKWSYKITGIDQGIHNWIVYNESESFSGFEIKENGDWVATIGLTNPDNIKIKLDTIYLYDRCPKVVHQYDRKPNVESYINESF